MITPVEKGRDLEARLIDSYIIQCQAEAQEGILRYTCLLGWEVTAFVGFCYVLQSLFCSNAGFFFPSTEGFWLNEEGCF